MINSTLTGFPEAIWMVVVRAWAPSTTIGGCPVKPRKPNASSKGTQTQARRCHACVERSSATTKSQWPDASHDKKGRQPWCRTLNTPDRIKNAPNRCSKGLNSMPDSARTKCPYARFEPVFSNATGKRCESGGTRESGNRAKNQLGGTRHNSQKLKRGKKRTRRKTSILK